MLRTNKNERQCTLCRTIDVDHEYTFIHYNRRILKASAARGCPVCGFLYGVLILDSNVFNESHNQNEKLVITHRGPKLEVLDFESRMTEFEFYRTLGLETFI